ncbi:MAG TPA: hypothetical protein VGF94_29185 [Kofleriaceae bacterium]|jgi:hypothetical protein
MAEEHPGPEGTRRKHRHDLGQEDHGSKLAAGTTRAIQTLLGLWIALTLGLVVYVLVDSGRSTPAVPSATSAP